MKVKEYQTYETFKTVTFESAAGYKVEFTIDNGGDITLEAQSVTLAEIKECIEIIEKCFRSGKLEITL